MNNKLNKNADYFIISDAHVGSHSHIDTCNYSKLIPFLKKVLKETNAILILNGDFFEFTKFIKSKVKKKNSEIIEILSCLEKQNRLIRIKGNHDCCNGIEKIVINNSILILHGDIFENSFNLLPWVNNVFSWGVNVAEHLFGMNINKILQKLVKYDRLKIRGLKIEQKAKEFLKSHPEYKAIIIGHSHIPAKNEGYFNCGCFINGNSDYIEITGSTIQLKKY